MNMVAHSRGHNKTGLSDVMTNYQRNECVAKMLVLAMTNFEGMRDHKSESFTTKKWIL